VRLRGGNAHMNKRFQGLVDRLHPAFERLIEMSPAEPCQLPKGMPTHGIYLFSEADKHLYVGRTNRLRVRIQEHCRPSSGHNSAPFAFLLAREETGLVRPTYQVLGSRKLLEKHQKFGPAFMAAKERVSMMDVRFVKEEDPQRQALLEMYVSIALETPHNSFENH
jgi:hypothetical protein